MKSLTKSAVSVAVLGAGLLLGATTVSANHTWGNYHWARTANPFTIKLGDNVSSKWDASLSLASSDWSLSTVLDTSVVAGNTNATKGRNTPKNCVPTAGRVEVCNAGYGATGWLGIAQIWISGTHITQGTVKLNDTYFNTATYNTAAWRNLVMCQEVGHTFGLGHQDEAFGNANLNTCMDYTNLPESNQHPNAHDYELLEQIYGHLDTTTTIAQSTAAAGADVDSSDPKAWGKEIYRSSNGRSSVFEQDLGNGQRILRHVFWTEDRAHAHHD